MRDQLDYLPLLAKLGPAPSIGEVSQFLGMSAGYVHELISRGKLSTYEISYPPEYSAKDPRRKKRIVLNTVFEFLQSSQEAKLARGVATAINSLSANNASPADDPDIQRCATLDVVPMKQEAT